MNYLYDTVNDTCSSINLQQDDIDRISESFSLNNATQDTICEILEKSFKDKETGKCQNDTTILGDSLSEVNPLFFSSIIENGKVFCGDIRDFVKMDKNPYTGIPFSNEIKAGFKDELLKLKSIIKNTTENIENEITKSLSVVMADLFSLLPYPNNINLFMDATRSKIYDFIIELIRYNILSNGDFFLLEKIADLYNYKFAVVTLLKVKIDNNVDPYSITYAYNSIFYIEDIEETLQPRRARRIANTPEEYMDEMELDNELYQAQDENDQQIIVSIINDDMYTFMQEINQSYAIISLDVLILAIRLNRIEMIDKIILNITLMDEDEIAEIVQEIIYSKNYFLLPYLVDIKGFLTLQGIHVYIDQEIYIQIPQHTSNFIQSTGGFLHSVNTEIQEQRE